MILREDAEPHLPALRDSSTIWTGICSFSLIFSFIQEIVTYIYIALSICWAFFLVGHRFDQKGPSVTWIRGGTRDEGIHCEKYLFLVRDETEPVSYDRRPKCNYVVVCYIAIWSDDFRDYAK